MNSHPHYTSQESGFTLIEVVIAMLLLTIGLVSLAGALTFALAAGNRSRNVTSAKLLVVSALEQVEMLRNTGQLRFAQIANTGAVNNTGAKYSFAGFPTGFRPVSTVPGRDGIFGTADDLFPKQADGTWSNTEDASLVRPGYSQKIEITFIEDGDGNPNSNLKKVQVTMRYPGNNGSVQELVGVSYINNDARSNYIR